MGWHDGYFGGFGGFGGAYGPAVGGFGGRWTYEEPLGRYDTSTGRYGHPYYW